MSTIDYLNRARLIVEDLSLVGRAVSLEEQNLYIFRGLRSEFRGVTASLAIRGRPVTLHEFADVLGAQKFIAGDDLTAADQPPAAFAAHGNWQRSRGGGSAAAGRGGSAPQHGRGGSPSWRGGSSGR